MKPNILIILLLALTGISVPAISGAESILANPSFETSGTGGNHFGGWNQFGGTGTSTQALHGFAAARVNSLNDGGLNVSGFWQPLEGGPGQSWNLAGYVLNPASAPISGAGFALVNLEWRDSAGGLIGYDTFTVATAATPTDAYIPFHFVSTPAPAETAYIHVLAGLLQMPSDPPMSVCYDQLTCLRTSSPTLDEMQWTDFPGGRTLQFSDRTWRVKGPGWYGPGNNYFSDSQQIIWVDAQQRLHLSLKQIAGSWQSSEVTLNDALGYGDYIFTTIGPLQTLDVNVVLGIFLWQYGPYGTQPGSWWNPYNEIDVEYSRWGNPAAEIGQFVAQPWDWAGNMHRYPAVFGASQLSSHAFRWLPDKVEFRSWYGGPADETPANIIASWTYTGPHIPRPEQPRVHLNLWRTNNPATNQEVVFDDFTFIPMGAPTLPQTPRNVILTLNGSDLQMTWDDDPAISSWTVWSADSPSGTYSLRATVLSNTCTLVGENPAYPKRFYHIKANY